MLVKKIQTKCDVLVIGSGAAGLTFALAVKEMNPNLKVYVVERTDTTGGCTTYSAGGIWLPGHSLMENRTKDSDIARDYVKRIYPEIDEPSLDGFIDDAPRLFDFFLSKNVKFETMSTYPDYYQEIEGATTGRSVFPLIYTGSKSVRSIVRKTPIFFVPATIVELMSWGLHRIMKWNKTLLAKRKLLGHLTMGRALIAFLLDACFKAGVDVSLNSSVDEIIIQNGEFAGAIVNGQKISAPVGMLACGGFSSDPEMMKHIDAMRPVLNSAPEDCDSGGGGLRLGLKAGLKVGNPYCWWVPIMKLYKEDETKPGPDLWAHHTTLQDRCWPGGIMVNGNGNRFTNEAACYNTVGGIVAQGKDPALDHVWLIWGDFYVKNYIRGITSPLQPAKNYMVKAKSIEELAEKTGLPKGNLRETLARWNSMAANEKDLDFHRGESLYDQFMGDQFREGHPNIAAVEAPFQAVRLHGGNLGTKMGPVTDHLGRVEREDGKKVSGLYAAGNAAASFFGNYYPGAGATLGQGCVFAYRAAKDVCGKS